MERFKFIDAANDKAIDKAISSVVKHYSSVKAREELHVALVACCEHAVKHNDASKLTNLWQRLPNNAPHKAMALWLGAFTTLRYVKDKAGTKRFLARDADGKKVDLTFDNKARALPFFEMEAANGDKENPVFDVVKVTDVFIKRMMKAAGDANNGWNDNQRKSVIRFAEDVSQLEKSLEAMFGKGANPETGEVPFVPAPEEVDFGNKPQKRAAGRHH